MLLRIMALALVVEVSAVAHADELLVWDAGGGGFRTRWVAVTASGVEIVAERAEPVAFDGTTLWALQETRKTQSVMPCESMDDPSVRASGTVERPGLRARALGGTAVRWIVAEPEGASCLGEVWNDTVSLRGGVGGLVFALHNASGFACGAHGYVDEPGLVYDLGKGGSVAVESVTGAVANLRSQAVAPIMDEAVKQDCRGSDAPYTADDVALDGLTLVREGGDAHAVYAFYVPAEAEWNFACTIGHDVSGPIPTGKGLDPLEASGEKALAHLAVSGIFGYSRMTLTGPGREAALAAFKDGKTVAPPPKAVAPAAPGGSANALVDAGRKATREKRLPAAIASFDAAIAKDARVAGAWSGRAYAKLLSGDLDGAKSDAERALTLDSRPEFQSAVWFNLGLIAAKKNDRASARAAYQKAFDAKPSDALKKKIDSLK